MKQGTTPRLKLPSISNRTRTTRSRHVDVYPHPDRLPADVQALFDIAERDNIASGLAWFRHYVDTVADDSATTRFYVLRIDGRAMAVLPVRVRRCRVPLHREVEALGNYYTALYAPILDQEIESTDLAVLFKAIRKAHAPLATLRLEPMDCDAATYRITLAALREAGLRPVQSVAFGNWYLPVSTSWACYLQERQGELRNTIQRMSRKLVEAHGTLEIICNSAHVTRGLQAYQHVYAASWKRPEPYLRFMPGLITLCAARGWLRLGIVWLFDRPIAAQVWIVSNGRASIYKLAFDEAFKNYSPGTVLTAHLMQHVLDHDRVSEVDYLIGDDPYKKSWMSHRRERWRVEAYNPRTPAGWLGLIREEIRHRRRVDMISEAQPGNAPKQITRGRRI